MAETNDYRVNRRERREHREKMKYDKSIAKIAGSFLIAGIQGTKMDNKLKSFIETCNPLGIILFYRNIKSPSQVKKLCQDAQKIKKRLTGEPLIICLDQEGGYVGRFRDREILFPSPMGMSASGSNKFVYSAGYYTSLFQRLNAFILPPVRIGFLVDLDQLKSKFRG